MKNSKKNRIIIIPAYKKQLNEFENISLKQLVKTLYGYQISLVMPKGLEPDYEVLTGINYRTEYFDEEYFKSSYDYSQLLLSIEFYKRFSEYEYMLIHQLDCFIFRDMLEEFCKMGYDYIGAPIHQKEGFWSEYHVGNGGLSLRKIETTIRLIEHKDDVFKEHPYPDQLKKAEDVFFAYCGANDRYDYTVPSVEIANKFSLFIDTEEKKRTVIENGLPFGIHYFPTYYYDFWRPFIQIYGYSLPAQLKDEKERRYLAMMNQWMILKQEGKSINTYLKTKGYKEIAVYGMSVYGRHLIRELDGGDIKVKYVIDQNKRESYKGIEVYNPKEILEKVDAVINTVIWDQRLIERSISGKMSCPVISLEDIVFESYW